MSPSAGTRPDAAQLVDLDELLAAYRRPPAGPVSFGTSGHRGTSLKGTFTEAHVLAISEAIARHRRAEGISGPLFVALPGEKNFLQVGVVSRGAGCGATGYPGVFTRVANEEISAFIADPFSTGAKSHTVRKAVSAK